MSEEMVERLRRVENAWKAHAEAVERVKSILENWYYRHRSFTSTSFEACAKKIVASLKASALPSGDGWQDTKHKWNDGRPGYGYQCIYCGTIASYVNGHSNSLDDCPQRTVTSK